MVKTVADSGSLPTQDVRARRAISLRAIALGTLSVCVVCGMTNYNDHVAVNTFFIGSYLPLWLVLMLFITVVLLNSMAHRFRPTVALSAPELSVVLLMTVIGSGIPAQGLFRFFLPLLVGPFHMAASNPKFWNAFQAAGLPDWMFPVPSIAEGRNHPAINEFMGRVQPGEPIPYGLWLKPLLGWGAFFVAWFTTLLSLMWIFRRQWAVNERLPFPIASIEASLIAEPRPGKMLNDLLGSRLFWIGLGVVFAFHSVVAMHIYFPKYVPLLPLRYNLTSIMGNEPWNHFSGYVKSSTIYFTFVGIAYFIQSRISFSLWASFLVAQVLLVQQRSYQSDISGDAWRDQHLGACLAYTAGFLWVGRHHLAAVTRQVFGREGGTAITREENYRVPALLFLVGLMAMSGWLLVLQMQWWMVAIMLGMILLSHLVTARVVAETGLPFVRADLTAYQIYSHMPPKWLTTRDLFFSAFSYVVGPVSTRESPAVFGQQAMVVADNSGLNTAKMAGKLLALIAWTFVVAYSVSAVATLWTHYTFATPIPPRVQHAVLDPPAMDRPRSELVDPVVRHTDGRFPTKNYSTAEHVTIGVVLTTALQYLSLRSAAWPFLPVGYLVCSTWYIGLAWFSLMLGWLAKLVILRFGGASMYQTARPVFIGAIFGEALAAGVWMAINLTLAITGHDYQSVLMLPT